MEEAPRKHLQVLGQLAREYQEKYTQLEELVGEAGLERVCKQLRIQTEVTTDRFRAAQQFLFERLASGQLEAEDDAYRAATALCQCFDELRVVLQVLLERLAEEAQGKSDA